MGIIASIIAKVIEYFVSLIAKSIFNKWKQKKEIEQDESKAKVNADKLDNAATHEEKVRVGENLLNGE